MAVFASYFFFAKTACLLYGVMGYERNMYVICRNVGIVDVERALVYYVR